MENKINITELLKDCPSGMELNCLMYEDVYFDYVDELNIIHCYIQHETYKTSLTFNQHGTPNSDRKSKCVIFPKGKTTWEGFVPPCKFKDGDILFVKSAYDWLLIYKENENDVDLYKYVATSHNCSDSFITYDCIPICRKKEVSEIRLATEEEKEKLFQVIKDNGYKWNPKTKTLENLVEPWTIQYAKDGDVLAFDDETIVIFKDLYNNTSFHSYCHIEDGIFTISKEDMPDWWRTKGFYPATEEQCTLLFRKIKEAGYHWNPETKTLEKLPKFKIGDKIIKKNGLRVPFVITGVSDYYYWSNTENSVEVLPVAEQDDWELVPDKFDITTLKPFDKVLVRRNENNKWCCSFFSHMDEDLYYHCYKYVTITGKSYPICIPYEGNEHLLGTTDDCDEYYKNW